ncbi:MAG: hypothetical protein ACRETL_06540, partial [Gammaproteobacteria bacterium]
SGTASGEHGEKREEYSGDRDFYDAKSHKPGEGDSRREREKRRKQRVLDFRQPHLEECAWGPEVRSESRLDGILCDIAISELIVAHLRHRVAGKNVPGRDLFPIT